MDQNRNENFIIIDFLILKNQILYLMEKYIKSVDILNKNLKNLKILQKDKKGMRTPLLKGFLTSLESETKIVIETLKRNSLTHKINPIKRLGQNTL